MYIQLLVTGGERQSEEVCTACCIWCSTWVSDVKPESRADVSWQLYLICPHLDHFIAKKEWHREQRVDQVTSDLWLHFSIADAPHSFVAHPNV